MKITEISPYTVMERFPVHQEKVKHLFKIDRNFQVLCSDYRLCVNALRFWTKAAIREAPQRRIEYEALQTELENEILQNIRNLASKDANVHSIKDRIYER